jgi:signal peptidase II
VKKGGRSKITIIAIVLVDQVAKCTVRFLGLPYWVNTGGAFSIFEHERWFGWLALAAFLFLIGVWWVKRKDLGVTLIVGGALSNIIGRFVDGVIIDYIKIWLFPSFNIADLAIVVGVAVTLWENRRSYMRII